jgi:hypothetical protein
MELEKEGAKFIREDDPELGDSSEFLNYLIDAYKQTGDMVYRDSLLDEFEGYFKKYVSMLFRAGGTVDILNKDTKNFLRLFMKDSDRANETSYFASAGAYVHMIRRALMHFTKEDLYHEIIIHFLELLENYAPITYKRKEEHHRISFPHYIQVNIRYRLCRWIVKSSRDAVMGRRCLEYNDVLFDDKYACQDSGIGISPNIDLSGWVWGKEATAPFNELTEMERYLLWLRYEGDPSGKKLSKREISNITGYHAQTINDRLEKIKSKIKNSKSYEELK